MAGQYLTRIMERQSNYFDVFMKEELTHLVTRVVERGVEQVVERLLGRFHHERRRYHACKRTVAAGRRVVFRPGLNGLPWYESLLQRRVHEQDGL